MSWESALDEKIKAYMPGLKWLSEEPLAKHTSFRIGGPAKRMAFPQNAEEIIILSGFLEEMGLRSVLLGNGTNVLCPDEGLDAVVIVTGDQMHSIVREGDGVTADAGVSLARLAAFAWKEGLAGLEFAHGIPGSLGGGIVMNAGAYGGSLSDVLTSVIALWPDGVRTMEPKDLQLSYRHSVFTEHPEAVVLRAHVRLEKGDPSLIKAAMDELMEKRKASQPLEWPSAGSTFKRPPGHFAGALIEQCGLKGLRVGDAEISTKHAGFLINRGQATCEEVLRLIEQVRETVFNETGVMLEPEVKILR